MPLFKGTNIISPCIIVKNGTSNNTVDLIIINNKGGGIGDIILEYNNEEITPSKSLLASSGYSITILYHILPNTNYILKCQTANQPGIGGVYDTEIINISEDTIINRTTRTTSSGGSMK